MRATPRIPPPRVDKLGDVDDRPLRVCGRFAKGYSGVLSSPLRRKKATGPGALAQGDNPAEERQLDHKAITVKELCARYLDDLQAGLIMGKGGRPKRPTTIVTDTSRTEAHHSAHWDATGQRSNQGGHQQGPQGHNGRKTPARTSSCIRLAATTPRTMAPPRWRVRNRRRRRHDPQQGSSARDGTGPWGRLAQSSLVRYQILSKPEIS